MAAKLTLPSMLNYTRSIIPSNGVFFYRDGEKKNRLRYISKRYAVRLPITAMSTKTTSKTTRNWPSS